MTKQEWLKQYSFYRRVNRDFEERMQTANYPCGHDDMLYENFEAHQNKYLDLHDTLRAVINNIYNSDWLNDRADNYCYNLKTAIIYRSLLAG